MAQMLDLADLGGGKSKPAIINTFKEPNESNLFFFLATPRNIWDPTS